MAQNNESHNTGQKPLERDQVVKIVNSVLAKVENRSGFEREPFVSELQELKAIIEDTRAEIGAARPGEIQDDHIPAATDELDAVVNATADATGTIMDSCENIQGAIKDIDPATQQLIDSEITKIFEACSFQDITGQRITKVVRLIGQIDDKITRLLNVLDQNLYAGVGAHEKSTEESAPGDALLNGPQMPEKAVTQDDIDKILAEFD